MARAFDRPGGAVVEDGVWRLVADPRDPSSLCEAAIRSAERREQTPRGLLAAIARVESGRPDPRSQMVRPWPWTIDVDGEGRFYATRAQAIAGVKQAQAQGATSIDVGCMQVNLEFHPNAFRTLQDAFDPGVNAAYAAHFLKALYVEPAQHQWAVAVGFYHSRTPDLATAYRQRVLTHGDSALVSVRRADALTRMQATAGGE